MHFAYSAAAGYASIISGRSVMDLQPDKSLQNTSE